MKIFSTLFLMGFFVQLAQAQPLPNYVQTTTFGTISAITGSDNDSGGDGNWNLMGGGGGGFGDSKLFSEYDSQGNICSAGVFVNEVDFDPGTGVFSYTSTGNDGFIQKLTPEGDLVWAVSFPGPGGFGVTDIAIDQYDNIYASVYFIGTVDFDPGIGVVSYTSSGSFNNSALVKFNAAGDLIWARHFTNSSNELSGSITLDELTGSVYVTGVFMGTTDFDPGAGTASSSSGGSWDGYMVILNANGDYLNHVTLGVTGYDAIVKVVLDDSGNLYMLGTFAGTVDFDFSTGVSTLTSGLGQANTFFAKYSSDGELIWVNMLGGAFTGATGICLDNDGNLFYSSSMTSGSVDVDPGPNTVTYTNPNGGALIVKLTTDGTYLGHAGLTGSTHAITSLKVYSNGNLYVQGYFSGTVDFNPGVMTNEFSATANQEFIWMLNSQLEYFNVITRPGTWPISLRMDGVKLIASGVFTGDVDFDPTINPDFQVAGNLYSFYISEFDLCTTPTFGSITTTSCGDYTAPSGAVYTMSGIYTDTIPNTIGCDSILTINLTRNEPVVPSVQITTPSNSLCQGDFADVSALPVNGGINPTFEWYINDLLYDTQGPSINSVLVYNLDEVRVVMTSSESCVVFPSDTSNVIQFTVGNPGGTAEIFISAYPSNILCSTDTVVFNSEVYNPGNNPSFVWTVNGQVEGENSSQFVLLNPEDDAVVTCTLQSSDVCLISTIGESEPITLDVTQSVIPEITITGPQIICEAYNMQYAAEVTGEGSNPSINWYVNGSLDPVGTGSALTIGSLLDGDELTAVLINNDFCAEPVFDVSNTIAVQLYNGGDPIIAVNPSLYDVCLGEDVTFTASYANGGDSPVFQWYLNGMPVDGENSDTFTIPGLTADAEVMCEFSSSIPCTNTSVVYSSPVTVAVHNAALTELYFQKCPDETIVVGGVEYTEPGFYVDSVNVTFFGCDSIVTITIVNENTPDMDVFVNGNTLTVDQAGGVYQWLDCNNNFLPINGADGQSYSPAVTGSYAVEIIVGECSFVSECMDITIIGVEEQSPLAVLVFPNPANDMLTLDCPEGITSISIENMAGQILYRQDKIQSHQAPIAIDTYDSGIYLVRLTTNGGSVLQTLFVKQ